MYRERANDKVTRKEELNKLFIFLTVCYQPIRREKLHIEQFSAS